MKKLLALVLAILMILPLAACSSSLSTEEPAATGETAAAEETKKTEEKKEDEKITYPDAFAVGYSIGDISTVPVPIYDTTAETVHDPLQLTCIAVSDGEGNVALIMTADLKGMKREIFERSCTIIEKNFGIPADNVMISCTHTHSAPTVANASEYTRFLSK